MYKKTDKKYLILIIPLVALIAIGILNGKVFSQEDRGLLGHFKSMGGIGATVADCDICHDFAIGYYNSPPDENLRWVKKQIQWPPGIGLIRDVKFNRFSKDELPIQSRPYDGTLADGNPALLDGPCEVCHTPPTSYHTNTDDGVDHYDGQNCTGCHPHFENNIVDYFEPGLVGGQSHSTHFEDPKGPRLGAGSCTVCHYPGNFRKFGTAGDTLENTTVCDTCHSPLGTYDGVGNLDTGDPDSVSFGAKLNWETAVYERSEPEVLWPDTLKDGKDKWCAGCHDEAPAIIHEVNAPKVMGDSIKYGYYVSGHGRADIGHKCKKCHSFLKCNLAGDDCVLHTDGEARTYEASLNNYQDGYRLRLPLIIPRNAEADTFELCTECHVWTDLIGPNSFFRYDKVNGGLNYLNLHKAHVVEGDISWDSDWNQNATNCNDGECVDSNISCTACHNVHGSAMSVGGVKYPCPPMIRYGELISRQAYNKEPAFDFRWKDKDGVRVTEFNKSWYGGLLCDSYPNVSYNHVCWGCHEQGLSQYYRAPGKLFINRVWTSDSSGNEKTIFARGEAIKYHVDFTIVGKKELFYLVKATWLAKYVTGTSWERTFNSQETIDPGGYHWTWDDSIPMTASSPSDAKIKVTIEMSDEAGGTVIATKTLKFLFKVKG